jgi:hypothetical protein
MPFPQPNVIKKLSAQIHKAFGQNYRIWNVSEYSYPTDSFDDQVVDYVNCGYPNPTLAQIYMVSKEMATFLDADPENIAFIHCQKSLTRSILILSCFLYHVRMCPTAAEALAFVVKRLEHVDPTIQNLESGCNLIYLNYFTNLYGDVPFSWKKIKIKKIIFSETPDIILLPDHAKDPILNQIRYIRPYLQIFKKDKIVYNSLESEKIKDSRQDGQAIMFTPDHIVEGDFLLRFRHYLSSEVRYPIGRIMLHSCMVHDQMIRVHKRELDLGESVEVYSDFFIDIIVEHIPEEAEDFTLMKKIRENEKKKSTMDEFLIKPDKEIITKGEKGSPKCGQLSPTEAETRAQKKSDAGAKEEFVINDEPSSGNLSDSDRKGSGVTGDGDLGSPLESKESNLEEEEKARIDKVLELGSNSSSGESGDTDESEEEEIDDYLENLEKNA